MDNNANDKHIGRFLSKHNGKYLILYFYTHFVGVPRKFHRFIDICLIFSTTDHTLPGATR